MSVFFPSVQDFQSLFKDKSLQVPKYQRAYSWGKEQIDTLWKDITDQLLDDETNEYFVGAIVLCRKSEEEPLEIIDGQQRLTTISLFLTELRNSFDKLAGLKSPNPLVKK